MFFRLIKNAYILWIINIYDLMSLYLFAFPDSPICISKSLTAHDEPFMRLWYEGHCIGYANETVRKLKATNQTNQFKIKLKVFFRGNKTNKELINRVCAFEAWLKW